MAVVRFEITGTEPYEGGRAFGEVGPYDRIDAVAHYAVDPDHPANAAIVDLGSARRDSDGLVHFRGDAVVLRPTDSTPSHQVGVMEVPNRGRRLITGLANRGVPDDPPTRRIAVGDGFLMERGHPLAWCGWQWDVPRDPARMGLDAPPALGPDGRALTGWIQQRIQVPADVETVALTDQHVGPLGAHEPIPTVDVDDAAAVLHQRDGLHDEPEVVPRNRWRFATVAGGDCTADPGSVWVDGGLRAGRIYDLVYRTATCPVVGTGLLAVRDLAAFLRGRHPDNPLRDHVDRIAVTGVSQDSRLLRTLLYLGLDVDESGGPAFDGVLGLVGGGRRGEFNCRFGQPSVQPTPNFGHLFPFADLAQTDPRTGRRAGLLERVASRTDPPRVMFADTAAEYWRGDGGLAHTSVVDGSDVPDAPFVRRYLFAGCQHGPGLAELNDVTPQGMAGGNPLNIVDYTPLYRCALINLVRWISEGVDPPPSQVPRTSDGSATTRDAVLGHLSAIPGARLPETAQLPVLRALDLGPEAESGVGRYPATPFGDPYPVAVSAVDADGNEVAGIRMPDVSVPVATHLGFNPRRSDTGGSGQILEYSGSSLPFAPTADVRRERGDPRPALDERYADLGDYERRVRTAAGQLVADGHLLDDDVELCVRLASRRYRLVAGVDAAVASG